MHNWATTDCIVTFLHIDENFSSQEQVHAELVTSNSSWCISDEPLSFFSSFVLHPSHKQAMRRRTKGKRMSNTFNVQSPIHALYK